MKVLQSIIGLLELWVLVHPGKGNPKPETVIYHVQRSKNQFLLKQKKIKSTAKFRDNTLTYFEPGGQHPLDPSWLVYFQL